MEVPRRLQRLRDVRVLEGGEPVQLTATESCQELVEAGCASEGAGILSPFLSKSLSVGTGRGARGEVLHQVTSRDLSPSILPAH